MSDYAATQDVTGLAEGEFAVAITGGNGAGQYLAVRVGPVHADVDTLGPSGVRMLRARAYVRAVEKDGTTRLNGAGVPIKMEHAHGATLGATRDAVAREALLGAIAAIRPLLAMSAQCGIVANPSALLAAAPTQSQSSPSGK